MRKYGILPDLNEKKIYFSDIGDLVDYKYDLQEAKDKLDKFFKDCLVRMSIENKLDNQIYKDMLEEYERIEHLERCVSKRLDVL